MTTEKAGATPAKRTMPKSPGRPRKATPPPAPALERPTVDEAAAVVRQLTAPEVLSGTLAYCAVCLVIPPLTGVPSGQLTIAHGNLVCADHLPSIHPDVRVMWRAAAQAATGGVATSVAAYRRWLAGQP